MAVMSSLYRMPSRNLTLQISTVRYHLLTRAEAEVHWDEAWRLSSFNDFVSPLVPLWHLIFELDCPPKTIFWSTRVSYLLTKDLRILSREDMIRFSHGIGGRIGIHEQHPNPMPNSF